MKKKINLSNDSAQIMQDSPQYDSAVKRLLTLKCIVAYILRDCVKELANFSIAEILEIITTEEDKDSEYISHISGEIKDDKGSGTYFDILFNVTVPGSNEPITLVINLEPQEDYYPKYPLVSRAIYYAARLLSTQEHEAKKEKLYKSLRKVYSIWICYDVPKYIQNSIVSYNIKENIIAGKLRQPFNKLENYDLSSVMFINLGNYEESEPGTLLRLLDVCFTENELLDAESKNNIFDEEFDISSEKLEQEVESMNAFLYKKYARGVEEGYAKRDAEAKAEAKAEATLAKKLLAAKRYVDLEKMYDDANVRQQLMQEFGVVQA